MAASLSFKKNEDDVIHFCRRCSSRLFSIVRNGEFAYVRRTIMGETKGYGPYGGRGGSPFLITGIVTGFFGRSGAGLDAIGAYINAPITQLFGGDGGNPFADPTLILIPSVVGFKSITIRSGEMVDSIQAVYILANGATYTADKHGGDGGQPHTINFENDETIIAIMGRSGTKVDQLTFLTQNNLGYRNTYGPFGGNGQGGAGLRLAAQRAARRMAPEGPQSGRRAD